MANASIRQDSTEGVTIRSATAEDLPSVIALLVDDVLGAGRETSSQQRLEPYEQAFAEINSDPRNDVFVAVAAEEIVGCLQLTLIPNLTFEGGLRAQVEGVRVKSSYRGHGLGSHILKHAIDVARANNCRMVQLTSNKSRDEAIRFYENLGFEPTHIGFKLYL